MLVQPYVVNLRRRKEQDYIMSEVSIISIIFNSSEASHMTTYEAHKIWRTLIHKTLISENRNDEGGFC